jgi:glycosyltransferase involved in cell wall biosynthesis
VNAVGASTAEEPDEHAHNVHARERGARILYFATQGAEHLDAERLGYLLEPLEPVSFAFQRTGKLRSALGLVREARARRPRLIVMEGTGLAGGVALLALSFTSKVPFVFSSGDAVGPYLSLRSSLAGLLGGIYERLLCRRCAGYIGWTPYLVGRALTFGAPHAMTAPGWPREQASSEARDAIRGALGIPRDALVVGLVGSLNWRARVGYSYGAELVSAVRRSRRTDLVACIVGDGPGSERLREMAGPDLGSRIVMPGRVPPTEVADYLAAFDVASLPQSVDGVGSFRYSTKLSEYLASELPIITGQIPAAYDLDAGYLWRLPGRYPWSSTYVDALVELLESLGPEDIRERREAIRGRGCDPFDRLAQQRRVGEFLRDILAQSGA